MHPLLEKILDPPLSYQLFVNQLVTLNSQVRLRSLLSNPEQSILGHIKTSFGRSLFLLYSKEIEGKGGAWCAPHPLPFSLSILYPQEVPGKSNTSEKCRIPCRTHPRRPRGS